jgi:tetratricopeptide (TPR) repeat protein
MLIRREPILLLLLLFIAIALFAGALMLTRAFHDREQQLAEQWFERGKSELAAGRSDTAIRDFRSALLYERDDPQYRLSLAQALFDSHQYSQSEAYFRSLLEIEHADGLVNLELARIAALTNRPDEAVRDYQNAIYGIWAANAEEHRREVRFEVTDLLLRNHRNSEAEAQLIALSAELPSNSPLLAQVAGMFAQVGDYSRASSLYARALRSEPHSVDLLMGLANAEFNLNDYAAARRHLTAILEQQPRNTAAATMATTVDLVLSLDPYARVAGPERRARVIRDFQIASARLQQCQSAGALPQSPNPATAGTNSAAQAGKPTTSATKTAPQEANAAKSAANPVPQARSELASQADRMSQIAPRVNDRNLRNDPDLTQNVVDLVFAFERQAQNACGPLTPNDDALLRVAALHTQ